MGDSEMWGDLEQAAFAAERAERAERAALETEGALMHLQLRTMTRVAWEAMQRGDAIRCGWLGGSVIGVPTAAIGDLIVVDGSGARTAVNVGTLAVVSIVEQRVTPGSPGDRDLGSFAAWLAACDAEESRPRVVCRLLGGDTVEGNLVVVASDHVLIQEGGGTDSAVSRSHLAALMMIDVERSG